MIREMYIYFEQIFLFIANVSRNVQLRIFYYYSSDILKVKSKGKRRKEGRIIQSLEISAISFERSEATNWENVY